MTTDTDTHNLLSPNTGLSECWKTKAQESVNFFHLFHHFDNVAFFDHTTVLPKGLVTKSILSKVNFIIKSSVVGGDFSVFLMSWPCTLRWVEEGVGLERWPSGCPPVTGASPPLCWGNRRDAGPSPESYTLPLQRPALSSKPRSSPGWVTEVETPPLCTQQLTWHLHTPFLPGEEDRSRITATPILLMRNPRLKGVKKPAWGRNTRKWGSQRVSHNSQGLGGIYYTKIWSFEKRIIYQKG